MLYKKLNNIYILVYIIYYKYIYFIKIANKQSQFFLIIHTKMANIPGKIQFVLYTVLLKSLETILF